MEKTMKIIFINHKSFTTEKDQITPEQLCAMISAPFDNVDIYMNDAPFPLTSMTNSVPICHNDSFEIMRRLAPSRLSSVLKKNEPSGALPVVDRPDFEQIAKEYAISNEFLTDWVQSGGNRMTRHASDLFFYIMGCERIWNDHVVPLQARVKELEGKWYCEQHPEYEMGHDGCDGAGIQNEARISMMRIHVRDARQELNQLKTSTSLEIINLIERIKELENEIRQPAR